MRKQMKKEDLSRRRTKAVSTDSPTAGKRRAASQRRQLPPRSSATNAYDLLADVCRVIKEEPRRYFQDLWAVRGARSISAVLRRHGAPDPAPPVCGTMACRAGWIVQLADGCMPRSNSTIHERAATLLGGQPYGCGEFNDDLNDLFSGGAVSQTYAVGTTAYASEGVRGVRAFMAKHKARLKAITFKKATRHAR